MSQVFSESEHNYCRTFILHINFVYPILFHRVSCIPWIRNKNLEYGDLLMSSGRSGSLMTESQNSTGSSASTENTNNMIQLVHTGRGHWPKMSHMTMSNLTPLKVLFNPIKASFDLIKDNNWLLKFTQLMSRSQLMLIQESINSFEWRVKLHIGEDSLKGITWCQSCFQWYVWWSCDWTLASYLPLWSCWSHLQHNLFIIFFVIHFFDFPISIVYMIEETHRAEQKWSSGGSRWPVPGA